VPFVRGYRELSPIYMGLVIHAVVEGLLLAYVPISG